MSNFDKYSNYNESIPFSSVVFGADKPLLEVELNEMQQIISTKIKRLCKSLDAVGFYPYDKLGVILIGTSVSLKPGIIITSKGLIAEIPTGLDVECSVDNPYVYFEVTEIDVTKDSVI